MVRNIKKLTHQWKLINNIKNILFIIEFLVINNKRVENKYTDE